MSRTLLACLALLIAIPDLALADFAPIRKMKSRAEVATACAPLGEQGEYWGLESQSGSYGCRNTANGNAIDCSANGQCTDYVGDPRYNRIKELLKGNKPPKAENPL